MRKGVILLIFLVSFSFVYAESIFLSDYLEEGQTKVYETDGGVYVINLLSVSDRTEKAVFRLNDEMSKGIRLKDSYVFKDGSEVVLRELVISSAGEGKDEAYYYFYGTGKEVLPLKNISMYAVEDLCNFDRQCLNETKENCCYDCGCDEGEKCENNRCVPTEEKEEEVEEVEEEVEEEEKEEVEDVGVKEETDEEGSEKKVVYAILVVIAVLIVFLVWKWFKRRKNVF